MKHLLVPIIARNGLEREIGRCDPLAENGEPYQDLKVKAERAAEEYNALNVG